MNTKKKLKINNMNCVPLDLLQYLQSKKKHTFQCKLVSRKTTMLHADNLTKHYPPSQQHTHTNPINLIHFYLKRYIISIEIIHDSGTSTTSTKKKYWNSQSYYISNYDHQSQLLLYSQNLYHSTTTSPPTSFTAFALANQSSMYSRHH